MNLIYYFEKVKYATNFFPMNLLDIPIYLNSLFNKAFLFFPGFFSLSSTIISKVDTSGNLIKSLKNISILLFS